MSRPIPEPKNIISATIPVSLRLRVEKVDEKENLSAFIRDAMTFYASHLEILKQKQCLPKEEPLYQAIPNSNKHEDLI